MSVEKMRREIETAIGEDLDDLGKRLGLIRHVLPCGNLEPDEGLRDRMRAMYFGRPAASPSKPRAGNLRIHTVMCGGRKMAVVDLLTDDGEEIHVNNITKTTINCDSKGHHAVLSVIDPDLDLSPPASLVAETGKGVTT